ncbi:hypothetical protein I551_9126 [Mycobacterium ulcerans str. Harvey]|uniref:Uncharacterized protein n=1 Tax=Mycobacterium ulcerans str. Harvey TaxID=1299332 RepID=A0ABN0R9M4_MYCUL|nr:hypothetical protein I551_9126 [Mycobacterium ulcerans str. Harvey]
MRPGQPGHEPTARRSAQMQPESRDTGSTGRRDLAEQEIEVRSGVGEVR